MKQRRGTFSKAVAEAMRRILVENARRQGGPDAGGRRQRGFRIDPEMPGPQSDLLAVNDAPGNVAARDARAAELVKLRFFAGRIPSYGLPLSSAVGSFRPNTDLEMSALNACLQSSVQKFIVYLPTRN